MIDDADEIVRRARSLVGVPFRPQGRDPAIGLDCIGVILSVFGIRPAAVRRDYRMRGSHRDAIEAELSRRFHRISPTERQGGEVLMLAVRSDQMHLAVHCVETFVHADAGLRRVVEAPGEPSWHILGAFRPRASLRSG